MTVGLDLKSAESVTLLNVVTTWLGLWLVLEKIAVCLGYLESVGTVQSFGDKF